VTNRFIVKVIYEGRDGELELCPLRLENHYEDDHLIAQEAGHSRPEYFRLSSINRLQLTGQHFTERTGNTRRPESERRLKPFTARIRLAVPPDGTHWYGFPVRCSSDDIYEVEFYDPEQFVRHLLAAEWVELLAPVWLKTKITDRCSTLLHLLNPEAQRYDS
jgi:hypothetical protein